MRRDIISALVLQLWVADTHWLSLELLIIISTIKEIDRAVRRWNHHYKFPGWAGPYLFLVVMQSGPGTIIFPQPIKHTRTREHLPRTDLALRCEMWGVRESELYWELGWVTQRVLVRPEQTRQTTSFHWNALRPRWWVLTRTVCPQSDTLLSPSPPQDGLLVKWRSDKIYRWPAFLRHSVSSRAGIKYKLSMGFREFVFYAPGP